MPNIYTLKVYIPGSASKIYRVFEVVGSDSLDDLCRMILNAFDFDYDHLYEFCMDKKPYRRGGLTYMCSYALDYEDQPSTSITLDEMGLYKGQNFIFHYDFGDDWQFTIHVQKVEGVEGSRGSRLVKSLGKLEQYPSWDDDEDWDDDDEEDEED